MFCLQFIVTGILGLMAGKKKTKSAVVYQTFTSLLLSGMLDNKLKLVLY